MTVIRFKTNLKQSKAFSRRIHQEDIEDRKGLSLVRVFAGILPDSFDVDITQGGRWLNLHKNGNHVARMAITYREFREVLGKHGMRQLRKDAA